MKIRPLRLGLAWIAALAGNHALAADAPPLEFRGVPMGSSMRAIQALFPTPLDCVQDLCFLHVWQAVDTACPPNMPAQSSCLTEHYQRYGYGPATTVDSYLFFAKDDRLGVVGVSFDRAQWQAMVDAVSVKYGPPTQLRTGTAPKGADGRSSREAHWQLADGTIKVRERVTVRKGRTLADVVLTANDKPPTAEERKRELNDAAKRL